MGKVTRKYGSKYYKAVLKWIGHCMRKTKEAQIRRYNMELLKPPPLSGILKNLRDLKKERYIDDSTERIGATVTQVEHHPYAASVLQNGTYICSATILNKYWLLSVSKCITSDHTSYIIREYLEEFRVRAGSSYNNKGGSKFKIKLVKNSLEQRLSVLKLQTPLVFGPSIQAVALPYEDEDVNLGYLVSILAWTPSGHLRLVNAPTMEPMICESYTKLRVDKSVCVGGVQDPNRKFCRRDNGGAVIQNNTLVAVSSFIHTCAQYGKSHAFPKIPASVRWINSIIWDERDLKRPTTATPTTILITLVTDDKLENAITPTKPKPIKQLRQKLNNLNALKLPFDPINVPLEPSGNSVLPHISMYESYLENMKRSRTSTVLPPGEPGVKEEKDNWLKMYSDQFNSYMRGNRVLDMRSPYQKSTFDYQYDYN